MLELIIFIIIIVAVSQKNKKKKNVSHQAPPTAPQPVRQSTPRKSSPRKPLFQKTASAKQRSTRPSPQPVKEQELTYVQPSKAYRPPRNAAERHEEWMPVPDGKIVIRCNYCGAENLISKHSDPSRYTCYFCREEL